MKYTININLQNNYLHAVITGDNSIKNVDRYLLDIQEAVEQQQCKNVLIEEQLIGAGLDTFDIFDIIRTRARYARDNKLRIAYIDLNRDHHRTTVAFGENLANILGVNVKVFSTTSEAMDWLTNIPS
ncbi:MAG: hypothetical protein KA247_05835 [Bacteroidetes bacterium]|nr:hypothetical protein [Bacteroidota bacterium]